MRGKWCAMILSNELVPRILRDIDDGVLALDLRGRIVYINPRCEKILGQKRELLGQSYAEVFLMTRRRKKMTASISMCSMRSIKKIRHTAEQCRFSMRMETNAICGLLLLISEMTQRQSVLASL